MSQQNQTGAARSDPSDPGMLRSKRPRSGFDAQDCAAAGAGSGAPAVPPAASFGGKAAPELPAGKRFVMVSCWDKPCQLLELDLALLQPFRTRLLMHVLMDPPQASKTGEHFWRTDMDQATFKTYVNSLRHGELLLAQGASLPHVLRTMQYEDVPVGVPRSQVAHVAALKSASAGVAFPKRAAPVASEIVSICEQVATAIVCWPRLESLLNSALAGEAAASSREPSAYSATRAWVRFGCKPRHHWARHDDPMVSLANTWPDWFASAVQAVARAQLQLVREGKVKPDARDRQAHNVLADRCESHPDGFFWHVHLDHGINTDREAKIEQVAVDRLVSELRDTVKNSALSKPPASGSGGARPKRPDNVTYACAFFHLGEQVVNRTPNVATIFSGTCCDEGGNTFERQQLAKALRQRGIAVKRWAEIEKLEAVVFPRSWDPCTVISNNFTAAVLLDFSGAR